MRCRSNSALKEVASDAIRRKREIFFDNIVAKRTAAATFWEMVPH